MPLCNSTEYLHLSSPNDFNKDQYANVNCILIRITKKEEEVGEFITSIQDTSWISKLSPIDQITLKKTVERSIESIYSTYRNKESNELIKAFGEYLVTSCSQNALSLLFYHTKLPLAELIKEKISGNAGFDFHTISPEKILIFGEGKFSEKSTRHSDAVNQISTFIELEKDHAELASFKTFLTEDVQNNIVDGFKGYAAAFSVQNKDVDLIFSRASQLERFASITEHREIYIIAVEIC